MNHQANKWLIDPIKPSKACQRHVCADGLVTWSRLPVTVRPRPLTAQSIIRRDFAANDQNNRNLKCGQNITEISNDSRSREVDDYQTFMMNVLHGPEPTSILQPPLSFVLTTIPTKKLENNQDISSGRVDYPQQQQQQQQQQPYQIPSQRPKSAAFPSRPVLSGNMRTKSAKQRPKSSVMNSAIGGNSTTNYGKPFGIEFQPQWDFIADAQPPLDPQEEDAIFKELLNKKSPKRNGTPAAGGSQISHRNQNNSILKNSPSHEIVNPLLTNSEEDFSDFINRKDHPAVIRQFLSTKVISPDQRRPKTSTVSRCFPMPGTVDERVQGNQLMRRSTSAKLYVGTTVVKPATSSSNNNNNNTVFIIPTSFKPIWYRRQQWKVKKGEE